ncbi:MAG: YncE family protein, partial [Limisphaerales bacterium]
MRTNFIMRHGRTSVALAFCLAGCARDSQRPASPTGPPVRGAVGRVSADRYLTPTGQMLSPAGRQIDLPGMRPQALALSPDGRLLVVSGGTARLMVLDPTDGRTLQTVSLSPPRAKNASGGSVTSKGELSLTGLVFSPDSHRIYFSSASGDVWVFTLDGHTVAESLAIWSLPKADATHPELPAGLAVSQDAQRVYVVGNLGNHLYELDAGSGKVLRSWQTGVAPYDVVLAGSKAYVSNLGGRIPDDGDLTAPAGKGTTVLVDPVRHISSEGSVTVVDLAAGLVKTEIMTGLHASALAVAPGAEYVVVANTGSDTLSV